MILTNSHGRKVNVEGFSIRLMRGNGEGESGDPVLLLMGEYSYISKSGMFLYNKEVLARMPATEENINALLEKEDMYRRKQDEIYAELKSLYAAYEKEHGNCWVDDQQMIKFQKGYAFPELDEAVKEGQNKIPVPRQPRTR